MSRRPAHAQTASDTHTITVLALNQICFLYRPLQPHVQAAQLAACYPALYTCRGAEQAAEQAEAARCVTVQRTLVVGNTHELVREGEVGSARVHTLVHSLHVCGAAF